MAWSIFLIERLIDAFVGSIAATISATEISDCEKRLEIEVGGCEGFRGAFPAIDHSNHADDIGAFPGDGLGCFDGGTAGCRYVLDDDDLLA